VLQCVAVRMLQYDAVRCTTLQLRNAISRAVNLLFQFVAVYCNVCCWVLQRIMQCVAACATVCCTFFQVRDTISHAADLLSHCCSVLQCVAMCCSLLHRFSIAQCDLVCRELAISVLQCVAVYCNVLQCMQCMLHTMYVAECCSMRYRVWHLFSSVQCDLACGGLALPMLQCVAVCNSVLQCVAVDLLFQCCRVLQCVAVRCNACCSLLQHVLHSVAPFSKCTMRSRMRWTCSFTVAECCSVLQCIATYVAVCYSALQCMLPHVLQCVAPFSKCAMRSRMRWTCSSKPRVQIASTGSRPYLS